MVEKAIVRITLILNQAKAKPTAITEHGSIFRPFAFIEYDKYVTYIPFMMEACKKYVKSVNFVLVNGHHLSQIDCDGIFICSFLGRR